MFFPSCPKGPKGIQPRVGAHTQPVCLVAAALCRGVERKKIDLYRDFAAGDYLSEAPFPPRFLFGMVRQFSRF